MPNIKTTKILQKRSDAAVEAFHRYYANIWGEKRWHESLFPALSSATRYCAVVNRFGNIQETTALLEGELVNEALKNINLDALFDLESCKACQPFVVTNKSNTSFPPAIKVSASVENQKVLSHWSLDFASVLAASILQPRVGDTVLDLCSAPGGKSIVLAQMLWHDHRSPSSGGHTSIEASSVLHANEVDLNRFKRLESNLQSYLPERLFNDNVLKIVRVDGSAKNAADELPFDQGSYDKVLVDAPCSSERHIIHAHLKARGAGQIAEEMANWKPNHSKQLAKTQAALLITAIKAVKVGGYVLYATCSLSNEENDNVVEDVLELLKKERKKHSDIMWKVRVDTAAEKAHKIVKLLNDFTEKTKHGRIALPDHPAGGMWGPLYFCLLRKTELKKKPMTEDCP